MGFHLDAENRHYERLRNDMDMKRRMDMRCGICDVEFDEDDETVMYEHERCHKACAEGEQQ